MAFYFVSTFAIAQTPTKQPGTLAKDFIGNEVLLKEAFLSGFSSELFKQLGLSAKVRLADNVSPFWQANVERIGSQLDPDLVLFIDDKNFIFMQCIARDDIKSLGSTL
jgi:ABC-type Fe3+-citrate transport system substrate-binding protein